ncbi:methionine aminopeptidase I, putative [Babesia bigemina]|uniref:Methionine aminopeptidase I, putative n=1 Tax=Babesia bigemina TaxID=5866 RepID=A0A061DCU4_BABBI|nr:methionine aminopeptidase I, putative [Babesia bigemina]CDR98007.1 methionine aminopeptidase I, putative [Babesia bigemina]|eukprot:XP_012770193.1 methionine aminopeptidase I, putative [Babesia bigemina]
MNIPLFGIAATFTGLAFRDAVPGETAAVSAAHVAVNRPLWTPKPAFGVTNAASIAFLGHIADEGRGGGGRCFRRRECGVTQTASCRPKRPADIASQKHVLEKERYIRRQAPKGFGDPKTQTPEPVSNKSKEVLQELKKDYPSATIKQIWDIYSYTGPIKKGVVSGRLLPAKGVERPNYYKSGIPTYVEYPRDSDYRGQDDPRGTIKNAQEIEGIRKACRIAREILDSINPLVVEGVFTDDIDRLVHKMARIKGVYPSPLNYHGFPKSVCTSVNEIACHGIPDSTVLSAGDLLNVDVTVYADGFHGDVSETFIVLPAKDPKRVANRKTEIGMYERNKMRYHASLHDNVWDAGATIMMQLNLLQALDAAVRRLQVNDGWGEWFEYLYTDDTDRKPLFLSNKEDDFKRIGTRVAMDVETLYNTVNQESSYDGRIVGIPATQIPTTISPPGQPKKFTTIPNPDIIRHIFQKADPNRHLKPYLFSHTFEDDVALMKVAYDALMRAIQICAPGVRVNEIGRVIREWVEANNCNVLPNLVGHGIGRNFHENPIIHHADNESDVIMEPGMVFTIEPIVTRSRHEECVTWPDGWTMATRDGKKTAQFEHTILITDNGHEILTKRLPSSPNRKDLNKDRKSESCSKGDKNVQAFFVFADVATTKRLSLTIFT